MIIYPAIDLLKGKCVRLYQGDYGKVTEYSEDPVGMAKAMAQEGADWIHIVDLDAAKTGERKNRDLIHRMTVESGLKVQTGGGIRDLETVEELLEAGVSRCVIGTAAVKNPTFLKAALKRYGDFLAVGIDSQNGLVKVSGWLEDSGVDTLSFAEEIKSLGAKTVIYTDINRDGALSGPALESSRELLEHTGLEVIMSGGIASASDLAACKKIGAAGVIVGKALYEGKVSLKECLENA